MTFLTCGVDSGDSLVPRTHTGTRIIMARGVDARRRGHYPWRGVSGYALAFGSLQ